VSREQPPAEFISLWRIGRALDRIADTLDDYIDLTLGTAETMQGLQAAQDPLLRDALQPLLDNLAAIRARRENR
jgi:hypothetical protein